MKKAEKIEILNSQYHGDFRLLTDAEVDKYTKILNSNQNEWIAPYAIREETNDIVSTCDSAHDYSDFLFSKVHE